MLKGTKTMMIHVMINWPRTSSPKDLLTTFRMDSRDRLELLSLPRFMPSFQVSSFLYSWTTHHFYLLLDCTIQLVLSKLPTLKCLVHCHSYCPHSSCRHPGLLCQKGQKTTFGHHSHVRLCPLLLLHHQLPLLGSSEWVWLPSGAGCNCSYSLHHFSPDCLCLPLQGELEGLDGSAGGLPGCGFYFGNISVLHENAHSNSGPMCTRSANIWHLPGVHNEDDNRGRSARIPHGCPYYCLPVSLPVFHEDIYLHSDDAGSWKEMIELNFLIVFY